MADTAAGRWREMQRAREIPAEILAAAPATPWGHDPADFAAPVRPADTPSRDAALRLLAGQHDRAGIGPVVLDVGCGGGEASLAVAGAAGELVGVDHNPGMLAVFAADCAARGIAHRTVEGPWPEVADRAGPADAVLCHHVGYNTVELAPFLAALTTAARRGVVLELTAGHPMAWLDPLWLRFHGVRRETAATADDALAVLAELGVRATVTRWRRPARPTPAPRALARRLCLAPDRAGEVAEAVAALPPRPSEVVTLTW